MVVVGFVVVVVCFVFVCLVGFCCCFGVFLVYFSTAITYFSLSFSIFVVVMTHGPSLPIGDSVLVVHGDNRTSIVLQISAFL